MVLRDWLYGSVWANRGVGDSPSKAAEISTAGNLPSTTTPSGNSHSPRNTALCDSSSNVRPTLNASATMQPLVYSSGRLGLIGFVGVRAGSRIVNLSDF